MCRCCLQFFLMCRCYLQFFLMCRCCSLDNNRCWIGGLRKSRYLYSCQSESSASFLIETCRPNKSWTAVNTVDRQTFLCRSCKIAEVVNQQSFSGTFSVCQDLHALLVQWLKGNLAPNRDESIWKATSMWHLHYAWRFTNLARISLYIDLGFLRI